MNNYKKLFYNVIKTSNIINKEIKDFAIYCADRIPEYFWTISASSSGKYHPVTDLGEGGLVRHSLMVYRIAIDLIQASTNEYILKYKNEILIACLFHDCCKNGFENSGHTEHKHPLFAAEFITDCYIKFTKENPSFHTSDLLYIDIINTAIKSHMGKWTTSKFSKTILPVPQFDEEIFVHECDYIASRKYCLFDEEYFNQF